MEIVAEIVRVCALVGLAVVSEDDDPDVAALGHKGLQDKGVGDDIVCGLGVDIFDISKEMDTESSIFTIVFKDHLSYGMASVEGDAVQEPMDVIDDGAMWNHEWGKKPGLEGFGTTGKLCPGRGNELDTSLYEVE